MRALYEVNELHELKARHARHALAARARVAAVLAAAVALCVPVVGGADEASSGLADAARARDWQQFGALLEQASDVDAFGSDGTPALHWVVRVQDEERARRLLSAGADPNLANRHGLIPLALAIELGDLEMVEVLIAAGADAAAVDAANEPLLFAAVRSGQPAIVAALLVAGAPVDAADGTYSQTALVAAREGQTQSAALLLAAGADVDRQTPAGAVPRARLPAENSGSKGEGIVRGGWPEHGMRAPVPGAKTPLLYAAREGATAIARMLLDAGADIERADANGTTPLLTSLGSLAWVDFTGQTPFLRAALAGDITVMRLLLEHGADPNIDTFTGTSPLMAAAGVNWVFNQTWDEGPDALLEAVELCVELGNDVNQVNHMGVGAVHGAANRGSDEIIRFLHAHGARLDVPDKVGRTPLTWAGGVFLATHAPEAKPSTMALIRELLEP